MWGPAGGATFRRALSAPIRSLLAVVLFAAPLAACAKTPAGGEAAKVVAVKGAVKISTGTGARPARAGDALGPEDTVAVPPGGLAVLQLSSNGHLVRIDEDLSMVVRELALFGAPRAAVSPMAQLDALLSPAEKKGLNERMAGFYATVSAADTQPALRAKEKSTEGAAPRREPAPAPAPEVAAAAPAAAPPPQPQPASPPPPAPRPTAAPSAKKLPPINAQTAQEFGPADEADKKRPAEARQLASAEARGGPPTWPPPAALPELQRCLADHVAALGAGPRLGPSITVKYRGGAGALRLTLEGALPVPACATEWFTKVPPPPSATWKVLEVEL